MKTFPETFGSYDIILASESPRRKELLQMAGIPFRTLSRPVEEHLHEHMDPVEVVLHLCREKAAMFEAELKSKDAVVITADTIVVCRGQILNKPAGRDEAANMLRMLAGRWHEVLTGVCLRHRDMTRVFHESTRVFFTRLTDNEISHYVENYKPFDKAGGYGIQEWIGHIGISRIEGSYYNVVGLPVHRVYSELKAMLGC